MFPSLELDPKQSQSVAKKKLGGQCLESAMLAFLVFSCDLGSEEDWDASEWLQAEVEKEILAKLTARDDG